MSNDPSSGNRWEPTQQPAAPAPTPAGIEAPALPAAYDPSPSAVPPAEPAATAGGLRSRATGRHGLVGAVAALLLVGGGAGGYALGTSHVDNGSSGTHQEAVSGSASHDRHQLPSDSDRDGLDPGHDDQAGPAE